MARSGAHRFGSESTDLKLDVVSAYLGAFTTALKNKFAELVYIDVFSGSGAREVLHRASSANLIEDAREEWIEERRGSARIALETTPRFTKLVFIEQKKAFCRALRELAAGYPGRDVEVIRGNADQMVLAAISRPSWAGARAVMFIDPYGMQLSWATLEAIRRTEAIDVWYLVTLQGLYRQAADRRKITRKKRAALNRMLGTDAWETAWYTPQSPGGLFELMGEKPGMTDHRVAGVDEIEQFVADRLKALFPKVSGPLRLNTKNGKPGFALFFACSNPNPAAYGLATKIADHILKVGRSSQVRPR